MHVKESKYKVLKFILTDEKAAWPLFWNDRPFQIKNKM